MPEPTHRIYSCDDHLDMNAMPPGAWVDRVPARLREAVPHVVEQRGAQLWKVGERIVGLSGKNPLYESAIDRAGMEDDGFRPSDAKRRMEDMERDGIWASIVYGPSALLSFPIGEPEVRLATIQAWNDWTADEFNRHFPDRLLAVAELPMDTPEGAVRELERILSRGHRGVCLDGHGNDIADPAWDRLWAAAAEARVPVSFHIGRGTRFDPRRRDWQIAAFAAVAPMQLDEVLTTMVFSGALERNPGLRIVLAESGVGWLPYFVARMDATFEKHSRGKEGHIRTLPSELFQRQVMATFEEEPFGPELIPLLGPGNFMWACDYPHPDSTWPRSREAIAHALGGLSEEAVRRVTGENCRELYGLP